MEMAQAEIETQKLQDLKEQAKKLEESTKTSEKDMLAAEQITKEAEQLDAKEKVVEAKPVDSDDIPEEKKKPIDEALAELKTAHAAKDLDTIDSAMEKLNTSFQAASQDMYQSTNGDPSADKGEKPKSDNKSKSDEEVTDVDFEEV